MSFSRFVAALELFGSPTRETQEGLAAETTMFGFLPEKNKGILVAYDGLALDRLGPD